MAHYWSRSRTPTSANGRATSNATTAISGSMCRMPSSLEHTGRGGAGLYGWLRWSVGVPVMGPSNAPVATATRTLGTGHGARRAAARSERSSRTTWGTSASRATARSTTTATTARGVSRARSRPQRDSPPSTASRYGSAMPSRVWHTSP
jgi:hypothetical protein